MMPLILAGLNHRTAPVELREKFSVSGDRLCTALQRLKAFNQWQGAGDDQSLADADGSGFVHENVILSTCNRLEIYAAVEDVTVGWGLVQRFLAQQQNMRQAHLSPYLYLLEGDAVVQHLFRVAAGLDSMILGEPQILGQISRALRAAQDAGSVGPVLSRLFMQATHAGKRVRTETPISRHTTSISHAAVLLARGKVDDLRSARALVVGAGEMGALAAEALHIQGVQSITCLNRTAAHAEALAQRIQGQACSWSSLPEALVWADIVITATGASSAIIHRHEIAQLLPLRHGRPLVFVDTAVPRDVEETVGDLPGVYRYDIDHLQEVMDTSRAQREASVPEVETIVRAEVQRFIEWLHNRQVVPVISTLRHKVLALARDEVELTLRRLEGLPERDQKIVARLAHRIVNKLLHTPIVCLKTRATQETNDDYIQVVRELFALETPHCTAGDTV